MRVMRLLIEVRVDDLWKLSFRRSWLVFRYWLNIQHPKAGLVIVYYGPWSLTLKLFGTDERTQPLHPMANHR